MERNVKAVLYNAILVVVALAVGLALAEGGYRAYKYYLTAIDPKFEIKTIDIPLRATSFGVPGSVIGVYPHDSQFSLTTYTPDSKLLERHTVTVNNFGWISKYPYSVEKKSDEFRIAVIGDSLTACVTNELPWVDLLQDRLNEDAELLKELGVKHISVLNLGVAGASMQFMANPLSVIAKRLSADFVIINFVAEDLARRHSDAFETLPIEPDELVVTDVVRPNKQFEIIFDGVHVSVSCGGSEDKSLSNPQCSVSPLWYVEAGRELTEQEVHEIKTKVARKVQTHRVLLAPRLLLAELFTAVRDRLDVSASFLPTQKGTMPDDDIDIGLRVVRLVKSLHKGVMVVHNPLYWHLDKTAIPPTFEPFVAALASEGIPTYRLEYYMPMQLGEKEWYRWYKLPHDGHWSDYGADVYARAMALAVRERLISPARLGPDAYRAAFEGFLAAKQAGAKPLDERMALVDNAVRLLPRAAIESSKNSSAYKKGGFVSELFCMRMALLLELGKEAQAREAWETALATSSSPALSIKQKMAARNATASNSEKLQDWTDLVRYSPDSVEAYLGRAELLTQMGDLAAASVDYAAAAKLRPDDSGVSFRLGQALVQVQDYSGAIRELDRAIAVNASTPGLFMLRGAAQSFLGHHDEALADYTAAIALDPKQKFYYESRAAVYRAMGKTAEAARDESRAQSLP